MNTLLDIARCRACRARIVWARSARTGGAMPLDADPVEPAPGALVVVNGWVYGPKDLTERLAQRRGVSLDTARRLIDEEGWPWHVSHHANCPYAEQLRNKKKSRRRRRRGRSRG